MKNLKKEVVISKKFKEQVEGMSIYQQVQKTGSVSYKGSVSKVDDDLYIIHDKRGRDICGVLDCKSFMEALMDTEVAHLWFPKTGKASSLYN